MVIGVDEVGLGAWAGPLGVTAVAVPGNWMLKGIKDSKQLELWQREKFYKRLSELPHSSFQAHQLEIDKYGMQRALVESYELVVGDLLQRYPRALVVLDGNMCIKGVKYISIPKADTFVPAVMAASIIAKVERDRFMKHQHKKYPQYGFDRHVGYGTKQHADALEKYGPCGLHRKSYRPIKRILSHASRPNAETKRNPDAHQQVHG